MSVGHAYLNSAVLGMLAFSAVYVGRVLAEWSLRQADEESPADEPAPSREDRGVLLTDEDRVVRILEDNWSRVGQSTFTEETDWSKSKVSRLLSKMEEQGKIRKVNVGRENVVTLRGTEPEHSEPPPEN